MAKKWHRPTPKQQQNIVGKISHGAVVKTGKKYVTVYNQKNGKLSYSGKKLSRRNYNFVVRNSKGRIGMTSRGVKNEKLPRGFKKVHVNATNFSFRTGRGNKAKTGGKQFIEDLRIHGIRVDARKKQNDNIVKIYTEDQKKYVMNTYNNYRDYGILRGSP